MLLLCPIHNKYENYFVSRKIKEILHQNKPLSDYAFCRLTVHKWDNGVETGSPHYFLEKEDVQALELPFATFIHLNDRDKEKKSLNDRFVILKMRRLLSTVCSECIAPLEALDLWDD